MRAMSVKLLRTKSYLAMIRNAARGENHMFRNLFAEVNGVERDIADDGNLACATFVSSVLLLWGLAMERHATVSGTVRDLQNFGWERNDTPRVGSVIVWKERPYQDGSHHSHIGFVVGEDRAVSNMSAEGVPREHSITMDGEREIDYFLWHPELES